MLTKFREYLILERKDFYDMSDEYQDANSNSIWEILNDIKNQKPIKFNLIPKNQYNKALVEFVKYGKFMRFPTKYIFKWKSILINNIAKLSALTTIHGHSDSFPTDEFADIFDTNSDGGYDGNGEFSKWLESEELSKDLKNDFITIYDFLDNVYNIDDITPQFSNGHQVLSDYATAPLEKLAIELDDKQTPEEIIVVISKILDVSHQRSDIAEIFIQGGSKSLEFISNN